ncbi:MAG: MBL fold metallo-hydrolase [Dehalococcoidia bacterium]|nr:MBL fold metallo-hydrolase [Dehalococcoidia bacterium]MDD5493068.1 MBL fold metallo-hydrolase [Dehalococcoidia bacterium]
MIVETLTVGFIATNCYVVGSEMTGKGMIIDPGAEPKLILKTVADLNLSVSLIAITHSHFDHIGALKQVKDATGAKFAVGTSALKATTSAFTKLMAAMSGSSATIPEPDILLKDGDSIDIDDLHFKVLYTPGHSPDGISIYGQGVVFSGDTLFNYGIGRTDFPGCSEEQLFAGIKNKLYVLPDNTVVYPGHGPETTIGREKRGNPFIR